MPDGRRNNKGHKGKAGRKPKAEEQKLVEKLSPLEETAHQALKDALTKKQPWAVKLYFEYMYGKPKMRLETEGDLTHVISFVN